MTTTSETLKQQKESSRTVEHMNRPLAVVDPEIAEIVALSIF